MSKLQELKAEKEKLNKQINEMEAKILKQKEDKFKFIDAEIKHLCKEATTLLNGKRFKAMVPVEIALFPWLDDGQIELESGLNDLDDEILWKLVVKERKSLEKEIKSFQGRVKKLAEIHDLDYEELLYKII